MRYVCTTSAPTSTGGDQATSATLASMSNEHESRVGDGRTVPVDRPALEHRRPLGVDDATVCAVGKVTEALEIVERARGHLYEFHQMTGAADATLATAVEQLRHAGHADLAATIERELVGRNVLPGRWSFQVVEDYDDDYYSCFRAHEHQVRRQLLEGRRHVFEAEMKEAERSTEHGAPRYGHAARPDTEATTSDAENRRTQ